MSTVNNLPVISTDTTPLDHARAEPTAGVSPATSEPRDQKEPAGCCGGAPETNTDACCLADEDAKGVGGIGCGCSGRGVEAKRPHACCG